MDGRRKRRPAKQRFRRMQVWESKREKRVVAPPWKMRPWEGEVPHSLAGVYEQACGEMWAPKNEHGAWAPYVIEPMAASILAWVMERVREPESPIAFLAEAQFQPLLDKWARAEARRMRFEGYIAQFGEVDERGNAHRLMETLVAWEKRSATHAERLGLDPLALARIRRELAELHKEEDAVHALAELQAKYARRRPEVIEGRVEDVG